MKKCIFFAFLSILTCSAFAQIKVETNGDIEVGSATSAIVKMLMSGNNFIEASNVSGNLVFRTGGTNDRFIIYSSGNAQFLGNLGIGVSNPSVALDVNGSIQGTGTLSVGKGFFRTNTHSQMRLYGEDSWAGIEFLGATGGSSNNDYIWYNGIHRTFTIGGGGSQVAYKKLHVHGGTSIGAGYVGSSVPTNGLAVESKLGVGTSSPVSKMSFGASDANVNSRIAFYEHEDNGTRFRGVGMAFPDPGNYLYGVGIWALTGNNSPTDTNMSMFVGDNGNVGIGTWDTFGYRLAVNGNGAFKDEVDASEFRVYTGGSNTIGNAGATLNWPDYVFKKEYNLLPLKEVEKHIKEKGHLPNIPSEKEVQEKGNFSLGEMTKKLLEKVEELTLYTIQQEKRIKALEAKLAQKKE